MAGSPSLLGLEAPCLVRWCSSLITRVLDNVARSWRIRIQVQAAIRCCDSHLVRSRKIVLCENNTERHIITRSQVVVVRSLTRPTAGIKGANEFVGPRPARLSNASEPHKSAVISIGNVDIIDTRRLRVNVALLLHSKILRRKIGVVDRSHTRSLHVKTSNGSPSSGIHRILRLVRRGIKLAVGLVDILAVAVVVVRPLDALVTTCCG